MKMKSALPFTFLLLWTLVSHAQVELFPLENEKGCDPASIITPPFQRSEIAIQSVTKPSVVSRTSWGCPDGENSPWSPQYTIVTHLVIHHSAGANTSSDWPSVVLSIWNDHTYTRGWGDIGYNYLIDPNGVVYEGRAGGDNVIGAHFSCQNGGTFGVCLLGTYSTVSPSSAALASLKQLLAWKAQQSGINPLGTAYHSGTHLTLSTICGHRDANPAYPTYACSTTDCPGDVLYGLLPSIRTDVYNLINSNLLPDLTITGSVAVSPTSVAPGGTIRVDWTEKNQGTAASSPAHHTKICLSTSAYGTTYTVGGPYLMTTLGVGETKAWYDPAIVVPTSIPAGNYYVTAFIDCNQEVSEGSNEGNNIGSSTPTMLTVGTTSTRIISVSGNLAFGSVTVGSTPQSTLTIYNTGNSTLTVSGISYPSGFSGAWSGTIAAGGSHGVTVTFSPTAVTSYGGTVTVNSDATSGGNTIAASGTGITSFQTWQMQYFGCTNCPQAAPGADPLGKGMNNSNQFLVGLNPTNAASVFRIISSVPTGANFKVTWKTGRAAHEFRPSHQRRDGWRLQHQLPNYQRPDCDQRHR